MSHGLSKLAVAVLHEFINVDVSLRWTPPAGAPKLPKISWDSSDSSTKPLPADKM